MEDGTCDYTCAGCFEQASLEEINFPIDTMVGCSFELPDYGIPPSITNNDYWVPLHVELETGQYTVLNIQVAMIQSLVVDSDGEPMTVDLTVEVYTHAGGTWTGDLEALTLVHSQLHPVPIAQWVFIDVQSTGLTCRIQTRTM